MCERKRGTACLHEEDSTITATSAAASAASAGTQFEKGGLHSAIKPLQLGNKKRRVSFCKTTKLPTSQQTARSVDVLPTLPSIIMKHSSSCTDLPQLSSGDNLIGESESSGMDELDLTVSPAAFVKTIVLQSKSITCGEDVIASAIQRVASDSYFLSYTEDHLSAYTTDKVNAVQLNDVPALRALLREGHLMQASNRFGESLLHTSCRRGFADVVDFFLGEARVCPRVRDDMGRTPMHDACWSSSPPNHEIMKILICSAPELLLSKDKRGHSPFDYARREYWPNWVQFLNEHRQFIVNSLVASCAEGSGPEAKITGDESVGEGVANQ